MGKNEKEDRLQRNLALRRGYRPRAGDVLQRWGTLPKPPSDGRHDSSLSQPCILLLSRRLYFNLGLASAFLTTQVETPTMWFPPCASSGSNHLGRRFDSYEAGRNSDPHACARHLAGRRRDRNAYAIVSVEDEIAAGFCIARLICPSVDRNLSSVRGSQHVIAPETPISASPSHQPMLTNYFLHFRVVSILMYYLRYRAPELRPCRRDQWIDAAS